MLKTHLLTVSADLDGIWDELGSLLLSHRGHVFQQDSDLKREDGTTVCTSAIFLSLQGNERICIDQQTD